MTDAAEPPRVVLPPDGDLAGAVRELAGQGWRVHPGFILPAEPWDVAGRRLVVAGQVRSSAAAQAALLCAVRGAGMVITVDSGAPWAATFLTDLDRLTPADRVTEPVADVALSAEQRALLDLLAEGNSIAQAARRLYLSLRTANRRIAEARSTLGVTSTREAVLAYVRLRGE